MPGGVVTITKTPPRYNSSPYATYIGNEFVRDSFTKFLLSFFDPVKKKKKNCGCYLVIVVYNQTKVFCFFLYGFVQALC